MEEKLEYWSKRYKLKGLILTGYRGGYPIIQFEKEETMSVIHMKKNEINRIVSSAEIYGGIQLGVGYSLKRTAFLIVNKESIVVCGHEYVIEHILNNLF